MRYQLKKISIPETILLPSNIIAVADCTFFKRSFGICAYRDVINKQNLIWYKIGTENTEAYLHGKLILEKHGVKISGITLDGRVGIREIFSNIPVQMCQFHQKKIIQKYLTNKPKLEASIELKNIVSVLTKSKRKDFEANIENWYKIWQSFLKEKTTDTITGRWHYTHKKIRAAYRSLKTNMPYLFTYQDYPELKIPNTTNSLEGTFSQLKSLVGIHRGINIIQKLKIIDEYMAKKR